MQTFKDFAREVLPMAGMIILAFAIIVVSSAYASTITIAP